MLGRAVLGGVLAVAAGCAREVRPPPAPQPWSVACDGKPPVTFDRGCRAPADCVIVQHVTDCCGSLRLTGLRAAERTRFETWQASCRPPLCECVGSGPFTDDGQRAADQRAATVDCRAGLCTTTARR